MPSRITIFTHDGYPVAELTGATTRSWLLNGIGRCQVRLATFTDANCRREIVQYGNFMYVEHLATTDETGTRRGTLPPWIGIIMPPQEWDYGLLTLTAYSAEQLLLARPMPFVPAVGSAGAIAQNIIQYCKNFGGFPILPGAIYADSPTSTVNLRLSAMEELANLSQSYAQDFDVTPLIGSDHKLNLLLNWYSQKGIVQGGALAEGYNGNMKYPRLTEQGTLINVTEGYNISSDPSTRIHSEAIDADSQSDYGKLGQNQTFSVNGQDAIQAAAISYNNLHSRPSITLELTALDNEKTFDGLITGNIWNVSLKSVGFYSGQIGFQAPARITGIEYDDFANEAKLTTKVLTTGLTESNYA